MQTKEDEKFIRKCIELSNEAVKNGDAPFGAIVVQEGKIIAEASNESRAKTSDHAEIIVMHKAKKFLKGNDLLSCTLYSNCEPCPMCSFMAREYKLERVIFAMPSPFMGGYSKWNILEDDGLEQFKSFFGKVPEVISGILEDEAKLIFDKTPLWMFGSNPEKK